MFSERVIEEIPGLVMAAEIGAIDFRETSAKHGTGITELIERITLHAFSVVPIAKVPHHLSQNPFSYVANVPTGC
jgi:hypothetical protein